MGIRIDTSKAQEKIKRILKRLDTVPWNEVGDILLVSIDKNFQVGGRYKEQNSFEGGSRKWEPRKRPARHRILDKSGNMRRRVRKIATRNGLRIVSSQPYSPTQQLGSRSKNIAARPFIVMQAEDKVRASEIIKRHLLG